MDVESSSGVHLFVIPEENRKRMSNTRTNAQLLTPKTSLSTVDLDQLRSSNNISIRSAKSSIYSQTSKLQKSSVFQRVAQNNRVESIAKTILSKDAEAEALETTIKALQQKTGLLTTEVREASRCQVRQSAKLRALLSSCFKP